MSWSERKTKFVKGKAVTSLPLAYYLLDAGYWLYVQHKPYHPSILMNWSISTLSRQCRLGQVFQAIPRSQSVQVPF